MPLFKFRSSDQSNRYVLFFFDFGDRIGPTIWFSARHGRWGGDLPLASGRYGSMSISDTSLGEVEWDKVVVRCGPTVRA